MDDTLLFIPPCCVDHKLPSAIMQAPRRALSFYTHGDVTMEKFYRAVSYLVTEHHVMVLAMPVVAKQTAQFLAQCFDRGWISDLVLSTNTDASKWIDQFLSKYRDHILYTDDNNVTLLSSHLVLYSANNALSINGPMWEMASKYSLAAYTMLFQAKHERKSSSDWGNPLLNILLPDVLRHRKDKRNTERTLSTRLQKFLAHSFPVYKEETPTNHDPHGIMI